MLNTARSLSSFRLKEECGETLESEGCEQIKATDDLLAEVYRATRATRFLNIRVKNVDDELEKDRNLFLLRLQDFPRDVLLQSVQDLSPRYIEPVFLEATDVLGLAYMETRPDSLSKYRSAVNQYLTELDEQRSKISAEPTEVSFFLPWFVRIWPLVLILALTLKLARNNHFELLDRSNA